MLEIYVVHDSYRGPWQEDVNLVVVTTDKSLAESEFIKATLEYDSKRFDNQPFMEVWLDGKKYADAVIQYTWDILGGKVPNIIYDREGVEYE